MDGRHPPADGVRCSRRLQALGLLAASSLVFGLLSGVAQAADLTCGAIITADTTLTHDLGPCNGFFAVALRADNITFDLGGHRIFGGAFNGVDLGTRGAVVRNGTVSGFARGVHVAPASEDNTISGITALGNRRGIFVEAAFLNSVVGNQVIGNGELGIAVAGTFGPGVGPAGNVIEGNLVTGNGSDGILVAAFARGNQVLDNQVGRNGRDGIHLERSLGGNRIGGNFVFENGFGATDRRGNGISVDLLGPTFPDPIDGPNVVEANQVLRNAGSGIEVGGTHNQILRNSAHGNGVLGTQGEPAFDLHDLNRDCDSNVWAGNSFDTAFPPCAAG